MHVFVTGATGFIGRHLVMRLLRDGHRVTAWTRDVGAARAVLGADPELCAADDERATLAALDHADAIINLAGAPIAARWTPRHKRRMVASRVDLTRKLVAHMGRVARRPRVLVSTSAVGIYGDRGDERLSERSEPGEGFLARLCLDWEAAAHSAEQHGARVVLLRLGVVLGPEGGALGPLLPLFRRGLGGRVGPGTQWMPWVHLDDVVELFVRAIEDPKMEGPYHAVAPRPVTNAEFTRALGAAVGRAAPFPVPRLALRAVLGQGSRVVLDSARVLPERTTEAGFAFRHPALEEALRDVLDGRGVTIRRLAVDEVQPDHPYLRRRRARWLLEQHTRIPRPVDEVFPFFAAAENLGALTPPSMSFEIRTPTPFQIHEGRTIWYRIRIGGLPMPWKTVIERWEPGSAFVDAQHVGPYRAWYHEHLFRTDGDETVMIDRVWYAPPFGPLGRIVHWLFIRQMLMGIFGYRARVIADRFGGEVDPAAELSSRRAA